MIATPVLATLSVAAGMPLYVVLGGVALATAASEDIDAAVLAVEIYRLAASPNLIAIPLFALAGVAMARGGAPERLVDVFGALLSRIPGGLAMVAVASMALLTAFTGASGVTILALGGLLLPMLTAQGYRERFSLGLLTASGSIGLLFPPSLAVLLYGVVSQTGIDQLFRAGLVPGALLVVIFCAWVLLTAPQRPTGTKPLLPALRKGLFDLLLPPAVLGGILSGLVTVTEAAACTAAWAIALEGIVHRKLHPLRDFPGVLAETALLTGGLLIIVGMAMALTNLLVDLETPMRLLEAIGAGVEHPLAFLALLNLFLLGVGCVMDLYSAIIVVVPLLLPLARHYGIDPVHFGIIVLANLEIGFVTPPVGMNLFIASQRFGKPVLSLFAATLPFTALMLLWLAVVTYVPALSLWWR